MWMPEYGTAHNVVMAVGYLIGAMLLGGVVYFTITLWPLGKTTPKE